MWHNTIVLMIVSGPFYGEILVPALMTRGKISFPTLSLLLAHKVGVSLDLNVAVVFIVNLAVTKSTLSALLWSECAFVYISHGCSEEKAGMQSHETACCWVAPRLWLLKPYVHILCLLDTNDGFRCV